MAPDLSDDHNHTASLRTSTVPPTGSQLTPPSPAHGTVPVLQLEHTVASEILGILRELDSVQKNYNETLSEFSSLKSNLHLEMKIREAATTTCIDLEKEKQRLLAKQLANYEQTLKELDYASKHATAIQNLVDSKKELASLEKVQEMKIANLTASHATVEENLRGQIIQLTEEVAANKSATALLEKQLSQTISADFFKLKMQEAEHKLEKIYLAELEGVRKTLANEEMKSQKLQIELKEAQQSMISWKLKYEDQLREMSANRHADVFKQKVMKLRKDNDMLKRQLQNFQKNN